MISAVCWIFGFMLAFFPLYALGLMGLPRRTVSYSQPSYVPLEMVAFLGAILVIVALGALVVQLWVSIKHRNENRVFVGDPWDGRSLEWSMSAPPPEYNFAVIPVVTDRDAFTLAKERGNAYRRPDGYADIELPKNSAIGPVLGAIGFAVAFGLVWHIWWMVILSALAAVSNDDLELVSHAILRASSLRNKCGRNSSAGSTPRPLPPPYHARMNATPQCGAGCPGVRAGGCSMSQETIKHPGLNLGSTHGADHDAAERVMFGFWLFLMSDAIIFGMVFATYVASLTATAGGPGPHALYNIQSVFIETLLLLTSSFTFGMASLALKYKHGKSRLIRWLAVTLVLGVAFLGFELHDFITMFAKGGVPGRSGFLSGVLRSGTSSWPARHRRLHLVNLPDRSNRALRPRYAGQARHHAARVVLAFSRHRLDRVSSRWFI